MKRLSSLDFRTCVRSYVENAFNSNGQCFYTCLSPGCGYEYPTNMIGQLLAPTLFSRLLIKIQQEELRRANIPNFEQCKYCTFGTSKIGGHEIRVRTFRTADRSYRESRRTRLSMPQSGVSEGDLSNVWRAESHSLAMRRSGEEGPTRHAHIHRESRVRSDDSRLLQMPTALLQNRRYEILFSNPCLTCRLL